MPQFICQHEGRFFVWSTITDSPTTFGMTREELEEYWRDEHGRKGLEELAPRIERALARGTSSMIDADLAEVVRFNRAGFKGNNLTLDQIVQIFLVEKREPVEGEGTKPPFHDDDEGE